MFKRIALITNISGTQIADTLQTVARFLLSRGIHIVLDEACAELLPDSGLKSVSAEQLPLECDMAIAIGGDGTMLKASRLLADYDVPLLGINRGRLGFLADIPADSVEQHLERILEGDFVEDERFQLHCQVDRGNKTIIKSNAFNDVIIQRWNIAKLIELRTYVDTKLLNSQRSDGMIIASPTGSTAYALSGGGPILHPSLDALVLVPICPHTLSNRPIVIGGNSRIEIVIGTPEIDHARLTCDGEIECELSTGDRVIVHKKDKTIRLIHPAGHDHFNILRAKLQWG
ncbi:MAG: NAD(+) kinase [Gammaproteobacteria bacterium]